MNVFKMFLIIGMMIVGLRSYADSSKHPIVSLDTVQQGKQAVLRDLGRQVDHVKIKVYGRSLPRSAEYYMSLNDLQDAGYSTKGSFTELFRATASLQFTSRVIPVDNGYYEVYVDLSYHSADDRIVLQGSGSVRIRQVGGSLEGTFNPYVWMPSTILVPTPDSTFAAKWVSDNNARGEEELELLYSNDLANQYLRLSIDKLDDGIVMMQFAETLIGYSLTGAESISGKYLFAWLGMASSGQVNIVEDGDQINRQRYAYLSNGYYYGNNPLEEIKVTERHSAVLYPAYSVWGSDRTIVPTKIWVNVVGTDQRRELQFSEGAGGWILKLEPGIYQIELEIPHLHSYDQDPTPGKG